VRVILHWPQRCTRSSCSPPFSGWRFAWFVIVYTAIARRVEATLRGGRA
jgi:hypothetical protein